MHRTAYVPSLGNISDEQQRMSGNSSVMFSAAFKACQISAVFAWRMKTPANIEFFLFLSMKLETVICFS